MCFQTLLAPLAALSLVWNLVVAPHFQGEAVTTEVRCRVPRISRDAEYSGHASMCMCRVQNLLATALIFVGVVIAGAPLHCRLM